MPALSLTLVLHHPFLLKHFTFFDIGAKSVYIDEPLTADRFSRIASDLYQPALQALLDVARGMGSDFRIGLAPSGTFIELCERFRPELLTLLRELAGHAEFVAMPYYHSLAAITSPTEFREQARLQIDRLERLSGTRPVAFLNPGLTYCDALATELDSLGLRTLLIGTPSSSPGNGSQGCIFQPAQGTSSLRLLAIPALPAADGVPARSKRTMCAPLCLALAPGMPPPSETTWTDYLKTLSRPLLAGGKGHYAGPSEAVMTRKAVPRLSVPDYLSGVPPFDLGAWLGNEMQKDASDALYLLEASVKALHDPDILRTWRLLQDASHFQAMGTRGPASAPGNPVLPYDAYINYMNILTDFTERLGARG